MSGATLVASSERPSLLTLSRVETRKMLDTRAGLWLVAFTFLAAAAAVVADAITGNSDALTAGDYFADAMLASAVLLPVVPILLVTGEWTQRTALTTFALVPVRERVLGAKLLAVAATLVAVTAVSAVVALLAAAISGSGVEAEAGEAGRVVVYSTLQILFGFGLACLLMSSAAAIVLYYTTPLAIAAIGALSGNIDDAIAWIDPSAWGALTDNVTSGQEWGKILTAALAWVLVPLIVGTVRLRRRDVS
jgi:ABC-2 type transport system permease protein